MSKPIYEIPERILTAKLHTNEAFCFTYLVINDEMEPDVICMNVPNNNYNCDVAQEIAAEAVRTSTGVRIYRLVSASVIRIIL